MTELSVLTKDRRKSPRITKHDINRIPPSAFTHTITQKQFQIKIGVFSIYKCSNCKKSGIKEDFDFCPYCGVKIQFSLEEKKEKKRCLK